MPSKALSLLGMARAAGKLTVGFDAVVALAGEGKAALVVLASDLSEKSEKELRFQTRAVPVRVVRLTADKDTVGAAVGAKKPIGILAVSDIGFADALTRVIQSTTGEE